MSIWDNVKKFAQPYADDDYDDYDDEYLDDDYDDESAEPVRRASRSTRRTTTAPAAPAAQDDGDEDYGFSSVPSPAPASGSVAASGEFGGRVLNMNANKQEIVLFRPSSFNDTSKAADDLRNRKAVVVNMENVDKAMARRVVDFLSGCVYALDGTVKKIAQSAYLFCPHNMDVVGDLETIQAEVESYI